MITFENVSKVYSNGTLALDHVDLQVDKGEFVFIVGSSGAGKSTFLKMIVCEEKPNEGRVIVNDTDVTALRRGQIPYLRREMGIVFQDFRLIDNMNVYDNIAFAMHVVGASAREIRKRVPYMLGLVGLQDKAKCRPGELSGGEQQRVAIARALAKNPKLMLCDEPTGALDYQTGKQVLKLLQDTCRKTGMTVIIITHNSALAPMADRVVHVKNGTVASVELNAKPMPIEEIEW